MLELCNFERQGTLTRNLTVSLAIVLSVYAASFFLPTTLLRGRDTIYGYKAFYWALVWPVCWPMWLANPVFWVGCFYYLVGRRKDAAILSLFAVFLGASQAIFFWDSDPLKVGYFVWLTSMLMLAIFSIAPRSHNTGHGRSATMRLF